MSVLIKGGRIVTAADDYVADIYVEDETVTLIGESLDQSADKVVDATGKYVLPGCVDPHTHLDMPFGGTTTIDDVESGQTAAAFGGTTTHVDFIIQPPGSTFADETLFKTMEVAAETGALVMVHAENGDAIDVLVKKALAEGHTEPKYHALTRPPETEGEATNRAIQLARVAGSPLYVVHVSCQESVEPIALAREKGWDVWGETCTQYLFIDYTHLERPNFEGAKKRYWVQVSPQ